MYLQRYVARDLAGVAAAIAVASDCFKTGALVRLLTGRDFVHVVSRLNGKSVACTAMLMLQIRAGHLWFDCLIEFGHD